MASLCEHHLEAFVPLGCGLNKKPWRMATLAGTRRGLNDLVGY